MTVVRVAAIDPAMSNLGLAKFDLDIDTMELTFVGIHLIHTESQTCKEVRRNSDDLRRAEDLRHGIKEWIKDCNLVFAEIPTGSQSSRGALSNGMSIGVLADLPIPLVEVQPTETKLAVIGTKTASKEEMCEWAYEKYPQAKWAKSKLRGVWKFSKKNEHTADACAIAHAGILTKQFKAVAHIWRVTARSIAAE